jgi:hypothetical protein
VAKAFSYSVNHKLGFPKECFDLVRMANLSLCIPEHKWQSVLAEVWRVLLPCGRLEIIDDEVLFQYASTYSQSNLSDAGGSASQPSNSPIDRQENTSFMDMEDSASEDGATLPVDQAELSPDAPSTTNFPSATEPLVQPDSWLVGHSKAVDVVFEKMLKETYNLGSKPSEFLDAKLNNVFEDTSMTKFDVHLVPCPAKSDIRVGTSNRSSSSSSPSWREKDLPLTPDDIHSDNASVVSELSCNDIDEGLASSLSIPVPPKAAALLGCVSEEVVTVASTHNPATLLRNMSTASKRTRHLPKQASLGGSSMGSSTPSLISESSSSSNSLFSSSSPKFESPGLLLGRSKSNGHAHWDFVPMPALDLEMHASKHVHTVLGCKLALADYVEPYIDDNGDRMVQDGTFEQELWDYEWFVLHQINLCWVLIRTNLAFDNGDLAGFLIEISLFRAT